MARVFVWNAIRFMVLIALQVALFKNIGYYNIASPFPYVLIVLLLPFNIPNFLLYVLAFTTGLTVDAFYNTLGVHSAACVALAFFRIMFFSVTLEVDVKDSSNTPGWNSMDFKWYSSYVALGVFIHHFVLYFVEVFAFHNILNTLYSIILSAVFTLLVIFLISIITFKRKSRLAN